LTYRRSFAFLIQLQTPQDQKLGEMRMYYRFLKRREVMYYNHIDGTCRDVDELKGGRGQGQYVDFDCTAWDEWHEHGRWRQPIRGPCATIQGQKEDGLEGSGQGNEGPYTSAM